MLLVRSQSPRTRAGGARPGRARAGAGASATGVLVTAALLLLALIAPNAAQAAWTAQGGHGLANFSISPVPELAWDGSDLWITTGTDAFDVEVRSWDGASWTTYPQPGTGTTINKMPTITHDGTKPWVGWNDDANAFKVAYLNAGAWVNVTSPAAGTAEFSTPDLLWDGTKIWAAWQDVSRNVRVASWNGATWNQITSPGGSGDVTNTYPNLAFDGTNLWITYNDGSNVAQVRKWDGVAWTTHSTMVDTGGFNTLPSIGFINGRIYGMIETTAHNTRFLWWDGATWLDAPGFDGGPTSYSSGNFVWTGSRIWGAYSNDTTNLTVVRTDPVAPSAPNALGQFEITGMTSIGSGGWTRFGGASAVVLRGSLADAEAGEQLTPWYELRSGATPFAATCGQVNAAVTVGSPVSAPSAGVRYQAPLNVTGLSDVTGYRWQVCAVDQFGFPSAWAAGGGAPDFRVDYSVTQPASVADGGGADVDSIGSTAQVTANWPAAGDGAGSGVASYDWCISTAASCATTVATGSVASPVVTFTKSGLALTGGTTYYVCVRTVDSVGNTSAYRCSDGAMVMVVSSTTPGSGAQGLQGLAVRINGTGFRAGSTVAFGGGGIAVTSTTFVSATRIDTVVNISGSSALGAHDVAVTSSDSVVATGTGVFTVNAPVITVGLSTLGYTAGARDAVPPNTIDFATVLGGSATEIGTAGSGQTLAGPAATVSVTSDIDSVLCVAVSDWTNGAATIPAAALLWKHNTVAEAWTAGTNAASTIEAAATPGTRTYNYDLRLQMPALQASGTYTGTVTYSVIAAF